MMRASLHDCPVGTMFVATWIMWKDSKRVEQKWGYVVVKHEQVKF